MIDLRERRVDDLRRHEVREDLLHPHIVEPPHRHEIAEPHVGGLVRDDAGATELLVLRGRRVEQQARRVVEDGAGVLHAAELERRHEQEVELARRDTGCRCSARARRAPTRADRRSRRGCARPWRRRSRGGASGTCGRRARRFRPRSGRRQTRRDRSAAARFPRTRAWTRPSASRRADLGAVGDRLPAGGHVEAEASARLQVGLIEAGERQVRPRRHEERVEELGVAVERGVAGDELDEDFVPAFAQILRSERRGDR